MLEVDKGLCVDRVCTPDSADQPGFRLSTVRFGSGSAILGLNLNLNIRFGSLSARTSNQTSGSRFKVRFGFEPGLSSQKGNFSKTPIFLDYGS